ncbi:flagellar protein FlbD [Acetitomaculum ruminis DSM 5522]|uniref:Flagellar protein FlbD n=1 Tax=Acetitomaculum ruminis DSM 5522 TaxID=1120918 RepID=A0A1I0ZH81_9FIRM|nr:flagellar FlbD family protein [Acetitomaculum ruminis]SFB25119.1 flagellar protein FlbD [Acetitomaculum ruminis DSM 5522]
MIEVTRFNNDKILINSDLIEMVEETPDTVISFNNGKKLLVKDSKEQIKYKIIEYKREIFNNLLNINE